MYDVIAVQEVSTGPAGSQAVALIVDGLNRKNSIYDYIISDFVKGSSKAERYAFIFNKNKFKINREKTFSRYSLALDSLGAEISRPPYGLDLLYADNKQITLYTMHAVSAGKGNSPLSELKVVKSFNLIDSPNTFILGDFNVNYSSMTSVFGEGYKVINYGKTTLKNNYGATKKSSHEYLLNSFDHVVYNTTLTSESSVKSFGKVDLIQDFFSRDQKSLDVSRKVSDHLPIYFCLKL